MPPNGFLLDEMVPVAVARELNRYGLDTITAQECGLTNVDDDVVLDRATEMGRVLFTHNRDDFIARCKERCSRNQAHAFILIATSADPGNLVKRLLYWHREYHHMADFSGYAWLPDLREE